MKLVGEWGGGAHTSHPQTPEQRGEKKKFLEDTKFYPKMYEVISEGDVMGMHSEDHSARG